MSEPLQHKMYQWEATPPPACWEAIASQLGNTAGHASTTRFYHIEVAPPAHAWSSIAAALGRHESSQTPVIPFYKKIYFRAAVAAALLLVAGGLIWRPQQPGNNSQAGLSAPSVTNHEPPVATAKAVVKPQQENDDDGYTGYERPAPRPATAYTHTMKYASVSVQPAGRLYPIAIAHTSLTAADEATMIRNMNALLTGNNYLVVAAPNGETTRASFKIAEALRYLYGDNDDASDKNSNENSHWKQRLQEWRDKISSSHFIPASTNFLDIIDLKDLIDEKP